MTFSRELRMWDLRHDDGAWSGRSLLVKGGGIDVTLGSVEEGRENECFVA